MTPHRTALGMMAAGALLLAGCADRAVGPVLLFRWALTSVDGAPLPAIVYEEGPSRIRLVSDTLELARDGTGVRRGVEDVRSGALSERVDRVTRFVWTQVRDSVSITNICGPNERCVTGPHLVAVQTGRTLSVTPLYGPGRAPLRYAIVP